MKITDVALSVAISFVFSACASNYESSLPDSAELGSPRGYRIARVITHFHSPYSYDACDKKGIIGGALNSSCLANLKDAFCKNRVDFAFITDHPAHQASYEIRDLLLLEAKDHLIEKNGLPYANKLGNCANSFEPTLLTGIEGRVIALGMEKHLNTDIAQRTALYAQETRDLTTQIESEANGVVVIPHTESRSIQQIKALAPSAIEIYNIHANLDPKIRKRDLGLPPFEDIPSILTYLIDPYGSLNPDFMFVGFFKLHPIYAKKWNELIDAKLKITGLGGTDSHENVFPQKASDGDRIDSHRRMTRFMSNHFLVTNLDVDSIKTAIKKGRGWLVFEGFGSPVGMDFFAVAGSTTVGVGETVQLTGQSATLTVRAPKLHGKSPKGGGDKPIIQITLKKVLPNGEDKIIATAEGSDLSYTTQEIGAYRAEVNITPRHLKSLLGPFSDKSEESFPWVITNHIYLEN